MYDKSFNQLIESPKQPMLDKDFFKCRCTHDDNGNVIRVCKNCKDWAEYQDLDDNDYWDGS